MEVKDMEFMRILPKFFTITEETERLAKASTITEEDPQKYFAHFLSWLSDPQPVNTPPKTNFNKICVQIERFRVEYSSTSGLSDIELFYHAKPIKSPRYVGIDIKATTDNVMEFLKAGILTARVKDGVLATCIIVKDANKAQEYVDIGLQLTLQDLSLSPLNLEDAVKDYSRILELVAPNDKALLTMDRITSELDKDQSPWSKWFYERERFRLQVLKRAREVVIDQALQEQRSELLGRKRRRSIFVY